MDPFGDLLGGPRARGAFALRTIMSAPWCLDVRAESPLTVLAMVEGGAWIVHEGREPVCLEAGDVAVTRAPDHYFVADAPEREPTVVIHPGQECRSPDGVSLQDEMMLGVRTWGNDQRGSAVMLVGAYESPGDISEGLLRALPPVLSLSREMWESPLVALLCEEVAKDAPGQAAVLDRLIDLLLIQILRAWFDRPDAETPEWYRSQSDPVVGRALRILHADPGRAWTLATLASETGVSRAALARRFHEVVGEPPMTFLTRWRLALAADLLCEPDATVGSVADRVGYSSPYALSTAFKRVRGISPSGHRAAVMAG